MKPLRVVVVAAMVWLTSCSTTPPAQPTPSVQPVTEVVTPQHASPPAPTNRFLLADAPTSTTYPNPWVVLSNVGYQSAYDETFRNPAWVSYHLSGTAGTSAPRPSGYPTDTRSTAAVTAADYPPGYDHGHMAPNEAIAEFFGDAAQAETFLMTNMLPQKAGLNRGPWKSLETLEYSRWEPEFHDVWVIDGPVYTTADDQPINPTDRYGTKQVCIPVACFKVIMVQDGSGKIRTLAFIMPQDPGTGHKPKEYLTSIREVERRTGLNFFSAWTAARQDAIETVVAADVWP